MCFILLNDLQLTNNISFFSWYTELGEIGIFKYEK